VREEIAFRDHHRYAASDVQQLAAARARMPGSTLVTTEKDAINLGEHVSALNPIIIAVKMQLFFPDTALDCMLTKIAERRDRCETTK
jgi:tetraacyldisaccharide-1-P 4'-kinase